LQAITVIATDVIDLPNASLTSEPYACACSKIAHRVQALGRASDEHPDWHGRTWYIQLWLAVATLSGVLEWFEAKRQFWNFDEASSTSVAGCEGHWDEMSDEEGGEIFVLKPMSSGDTTSALDSADTLSAIRPAEARQLLVVARDLHPTRLSAHDLCLCCTFR
jgi:hypothetical protein